MAAGNREGVKIFRKKHWTFAEPSDSDWAPWRAHRERAEWDIALEGQQVRRWSCSDWQSQGWQTTMRVHPEPEAADMAMRPDMWTRTTSLGGATNSTVAFSFGLFSCLPMRPCQQAKSSIKALFALRRRRRRLLQCCDVAEDRTAWPQSW